MLNYYLIHHVDDTLSIEYASTRPNKSCVGPFGSYYSMLSHYMDFTGRLDRAEIFVSNQDAMMECIDAITRFTGHKLRVYISASAWEHNIACWSVMLGTSINMPIISFLYAGDIQELTRVLLSEYYRVNDSQLASTDS